MPRANRYFLPNHVWHITHRCHKKEFLLKFAKDRQRWRYWLFEAKKRYGLCVLNYIVTSNHIHLLVRDCGAGEIAQSMQLIAGRTAQEYNQRKARKGAFWEDRYHATAVDSECYLARCMVYIDLNMVRAGAVKPLLRAAPRQARREPAALGHKNAGQLTLFDLLLTLFPRAVLHSMIEIRDRVCH